jgi:DNA-binding MarR family transcriptional regulator
VSAAPLGVEVAARAAPGVPADAGTDVSADAVTDLPADTGTDLPADAAARLVLLIGRMARLLRHHGRPGIGPGGMSALATLVRGGPMRLGDLAAAERVAPPTLTRMVSALEDCGLVERAPDSSDRRAVRVGATDQGEQLIAGLGSARARVLAERLSRLSSADLRAVVAALPALEALASDEL